MLATVGNRPHQTYVSLYAFVGRDFITSSYVSFFLEHAPRALLRRSTPGFLIRVEAFVDADGIHATESRCLKLFKSLLAVGEGLIRED